MEMGSKANNFDNNNLNKNSKNYFYNLNEKCRKP